MNGPPNSSGDNGHSYPVMPNTFGEFTALAGLPNIDPNVDQLGSFHARIPPGFGVYPSGSSANAGIPQMPQQLGLPPLGGAHPVFGTEHMLGLPPDLNMPHDRAFHAGNAPMENSGTLPAGLTAMQGPRSVGLPLPPHHAMGANHTGYFDQSLSMSGATDFAHDPRADMLRNVGPSSSNFAVPTTGIPSTVASGSAAVSGKAAEASNLPTALPMFIAKTYELVEEEKNQEIVGWSADGDSFEIRDRNRFENEILQRYFKHNNISSFERQLHTYGFRKIRSAGARDSTVQNADPRRGQISKFWHAKFKRGRADLLPEIKRNDRKRNADDLLRDITSMKNSCTDLEKEIQELMMENLALQNKLNSATTAAPPQQPLAQSGAGGDIVDAIAQLDIKVLYAVLTIAKEGVLVMNGDMDVVYCNDSFCQLSGFRQSEVEGKNFSTMVSNRNTNGLYQKITAAVQAGQKWEGLAFTDKFDKSPMLTDMSVIPVRDGNGSLHVAAVLRDRTNDLVAEENSSSDGKKMQDGPVSETIAIDGKQMQHSDFVSSVLATGLRVWFDQQERKNGILQMIAGLSSDLLIARWDYDGCFVYLSPSVQSILGVSGKDLLGRDAFYNIHADDVDRVRPLKEELVQSKALRWHRVCIRRVLPDKTIQWLKCAWGQLLPSGAIVAFESPISEDEAQKLAESNSLGPQVFDVEKPIPSFV